MFKKGGGAVGIMASGPELIKRFEPGGINIISQANANPVLTGGRDPMIANYIPGSELGNIRRNRNLGVNVKPTILEKFGTPLEKYVRGFGDAQAGGIQTVRNLVDVDPLSDMLRENQEKKDFQEKIKEGETTVDDLSKDKSGEKINETNKKILEKDEKIVDESEGGIGSSEEIKNKTSEGVNDTNPTSFFKNLFKKDPKAMGLESDIEIKAAKEMVINASNKVAEGVADFKDTEFVGGSFNENLQELSTALKAEGKEITLEDVYDEGIKLLGYDPRELDKNFNADRRQAFFMNLIKAGLYTAAGGSKDAVSNVALGLAKGLEGFGQDIGDLRDDLRKDRERATTVMFNLLKSKKSEQLAKEALDLDKKFKIFNITKSLVGEARAEELRKVEQEFELKKFNLNFLIEAKKLDQKAELNREQIEATLKNTLLSNKSLVAPFVLGMVKPAEGYTKEEMDFFDPKTYVFTNEGIEMVRKSLKTLKGFKPTQFENRMTENIGKEISAGGMLVHDPKENDGSSQANWETSVRKEFNDPDKGTAQKAEILINHARQYNGKIDIDAIPNMSLKEYFRKGYTGDDRPDKIQIPVVQYPNLFVNIKPKEKPIDLSQQ
jgi:hypothetical protein